MLFGGIEAGGTKFVCMVASGPDNIVAWTDFPTTTPEETIGRAIAFFQEQDPVQAVGIGAFGPVDLQHDSPTYGYITTTPKPGWQNTNLLGEISRVLQVPVGFDTDVNAAALGEHRWGAAKGLDTFIYLTVGTGVGGGAMVGGQLLHGLVHPEMGHIPLPHDWEMDSFPGTCPYHGDCLEGMVAGPAIEQRWGEKGQDLPLDHPAWRLEAHYLAAGLMSFIVTLSPQRIVMGGGVMKQSQLFPLIRDEVLWRLQGYVQAPEIIDNIETYIVPPGLKGWAGALGSIALAEATYNAQL